MRDFSRDSVCFIARSKENRKYVELEDLLSDERNLGELTLLKDSKIYLYTGQPVNNKRGNIHYRQVLVEEPFRLIVAQSKVEPDKQFWFITNDFDLSAKEITEAYRRRWDIEVFFRFIKQELSANHLISLNKNGIEVILYMTLITAMLVLIYKKANNIGYKTAKRRFAMEVRDLAIAIIVVQCGGDPNLFFNSKKRVTGISSDHSWPPGPFPYNYRPLYLDPPVRERASSGSSVVRKSTPYEISSRISSSLFTVQILVVIPASLALSNRSGFPRAMPTL